MTLIANLNPQAKDMDPRWPLETVDMGYVIFREEKWLLCDSFGTVVFTSENRSHVFFHATNHFINLAPLQ